MRIYSNIFIHIPGFTKSDLEFISNSTTHEEVTLLAATCGMFIEKIHFYDPSTIPLHNQYEMKLVDTLGLILNHPNSLHTKSVKISY